MAATKSLGGKSWASAPANQRCLTQLLERLTTNEGITVTPLSSVGLFRCDHPKARLPVVYPPCIMIVGQGRKKGFLGGKTFIYDANSYLTLSVPLPLETQICGASPANPFLCIRILVDPTTVSDLLLGMDDELPATHIAKLGIYSSRIPSTIHDATIRLLEAINDPSDCKILGPLIVREIIYRVIQGKQGGVLKALAHRHGHFHKISRVLDRIHVNSELSIDISTMARQANMSVSTFHTNFKAVTSMSPLQYVKTIRLHQARALMLNEGMNASTAAYPPAAE